MRIVRVQERHSVLIYALLDIWERSVRATHLFLSDGEIEHQRIRAAGADGR